MNSFFHRIILNMLFIFWLVIFDDGGVPDIRLASSLRDEAIKAVKQCARNEPVDFKTIKEYVNAEGIEIGERTLRDIVRDMDELHEIPGKHNKKLYQFGSLAELGK